MDDVKEVANFEAKSALSEDDNDLESAEELARQNTELQSKVASMSHKLAQLFNASFEYGGAKLLDYLQTSIGLTELEWYHFAYLAPIISHFLVILECLIWYLIEIKVNLFMKVKKTIQSQKYNKLILWYRR